MSSQGSFVRTDRAWPGSDARVDVDGYKPVLLAGVYAFAGGRCADLVPKATEPAGAANDVAGLVR